MHWYARLWLAIVPCWPTLEWVYPWLYSSVVYSNCPWWVICTKPVMLMCGYPMLLMALGIAFGVVPPNNVWLSYAANAWLAYGVVRDPRLDAGHATHSCTTAWQWVVARQMGEGDGRGNSNEVKLLFPLEGADRPWELFRSSVSPREVKNIPVCVLVCVPRSQQSWGCVGKEILVDKKLTALPPMNRNN